MSKTVARNAKLIRPPPTAPSVAGGPPLPRRPAPLARRFQQICANMVTEAIAGEDLVQLEYGSLIAVELEPGIDQRRLADAMGIDPSHACLIVDRLHMTGLVERRINDADRRSRELYLTTKGKAVWRRLHVKSTLANERILEPLAPDEREQFLDLLIRIIQGNQIHARPGAGRRKRGSLQSASSKKTGAS